MDVGGKREKMKVCKIYRTRFVYKMRRKENETFILKLVDFRSNIKLIWLRIGWTKRRKF